MKQPSNQHFFDTATRKDIYRSINLFAVPLMLTGVLQLVYNAADSAIVGRWGGSSCLAAVGATTHIVFLLITMFNGVSIGANYLAARCFGADDKAACRRRFTVPYSSPWFWGSWPASSAFSFPRPC